MNKEDKQLIRDTKKALHFLTTTDFDKLFADVSDDRPATNQELEHVFNVFVNHFYQDKETGRQFILKIKDIYEGWAIKAVSILPLPLILLITSTAAIKLVGAR